FLRRADNPFRTANSPTETFRIWPHRIRLRLPSPVRFPAREARSAGVFRNLRQEHGARETGWLRGRDSKRPSLEPNGPAGIGEMHIEVMPWGGTERNCTITLSTASGGRAIPSAR